MSSFFRRNASDSFLEASLPYTRMSSLEAFVQNPVLMESVKRKLSEILVPDSVQEKEVEKDLPAGWLARIVHHLLHEDLVDTTLPRHTATKKSRNPPNKANLLPVTVSTYVVSLAQELSPWLSGRSQERWHHE